MSSKQNMNLAWQGKVKATLDGSDLGAVKIGSARYSVTTPEPRTKQEEGGAIVASKPGRPERTLTLVIIKEGLLDLPDAEISGTGDLELTAEGHDPIKWEGTSYTVSREWINEEGTEDTYTFICPKAGAKQGAGGVGV